jgi:hypothetical protein
MKKWKCVILHNLSVHFIGEAGPLPYRDGDVANEALSVDL